MRKTVIHILSTGHAGSHYLSLLLGSHSRTLHVGELFQLKREKGMMLGEVYFTTSPVFEGIGPDNIREIYEIIFSRIDPHIEAVVDTSKVVRGWTEMFVRDERHQHKYVHLIRDPRALVRRSMVARGGKSAWRIRWKLMRSWPQVPATAGFGDLGAVLMYRWLLQNRAITRFIRQHRLDANVVTYRDLAKDTAGELGRLMPWIGVPFEPEQIEYWKREHIGTQKRQYDWVKEKQTTYFDLRWQTELAQGIQDQIVADRAVNNYLAEMRLKFTGEGLQLVGGANPYVAGGA
ncbi:MAG TPA: hypothetical protein VMP11_12295 [Verrucomicrobiae bacterium]|nr:hypothetical protein [Verrucomicrobiae bacterium]